MIETSYGSKHQGTSRFVIVAPHAAGDDAYAKGSGSPLNPNDLGRVAPWVAEIVNGSVVSNTHFRKDEEDFNKPWNIPRRQYYLGDRLREMGEFYRDIVDLCEVAREKSSTGRAVVVYIHGMRDRNGGVGIDIGCGLKEHNGVLKGTRQVVDRNTRSVIRYKHPDARTNKGVPRAKDEDIISLRASLDDRLMPDYNLGAAIGRYFPAWSRDNGVQFHAGTPDVSMQLEISLVLRKDVPYVSKVIAESLLEVYSV